jgi:spermidine synthase
VANHSWYQWVVDLLPAFLKSHPEAKPNSFLFLQYELPYEIAPSPKNVLILGAGRGNDVAAALRHGAEHIDAVELDPVILRLGKLYHPEHPYSSTNVTSHVDDARAFLKKSDRDVLVIDDWAMAPLSEPERRDFWEICEDRYSQSSSASLARTKSFTDSLSVSPIDSDLKAVLKEDKLPQPHLKIFNYTRTPG